MSRPRWLAALLVLSSVETACSVVLAPKLPGNAEAVQRGVVAIEREAQGMPDPIGHGRGTLFALEAAPVRISNGPAAQVFMEQIRRTFEVAGYQMVDSGGDPSLNTISCAITTFNFDNYTWLFPIVPTWGTIAFTLFLQDVDSHILWSRSYSASSWNLWYSFSSAVNSATAKLLERLYRDLEDAKFQQACCAKKP